MPRGGGGLIVSQVSESRPGPPKFVVCRHEPPGFLDGQMWSTQSLTRGSSLAIPAFDPPSSRSLFQPRCLPRMSPLLIRPDAAAHAVWCQHIALKRPGCLVLRHTVLLLRHPQAHPQRQMPPAMPCALFRQFARPSVPTLIATYCPDLSRLCV